MDYILEDYEICYPKRYHKAFELWNAGEPYNRSTDITNSPSYGMGKLDDNGFFEHPFPVEIAQTDVIAAENKIRHSNRRNK